MEEEKQQFAQYSKLIPRIYGVAWRNCRKWMIVMILSILVVGIIEASFPILVSKTMDLLKSTNIEPQESLLTYLYRAQVMRYLLLFIGLSIAMSILVYFMIIGAGRVVEKVLLVLRRDLFQKLLHSDVAYHDQNSSGWLIARITSDTDRLIELVSWGMIQFSWSAIVLVFCLSNMLVISWKMSLLFILFIPLLFLSTQFIRLKVLSYSRITRRLNSQMIGTLNEHIHGVELNKVLSTQDKAIGFYEAAALEYAQVSKKNLWMNSLYYPTIVALGSINISFLIYFSAQGYIAPGSLFTVGLLSSFYLYAKFIYEPIVEISNYFSSIYNSISALERIFGLLDHPIQVKSVSEYSGPIQFQGKIDFHQVNFGYSTTNLLYRDLSQTILPNRKIALVGPTGGGKSTIAQMLNRNYEPQSGKITLDDIDIQAIPLDILRRNIGNVLQFSQLFEGTLAENLVMFSSREYSRSELVASLEYLGAQDLISRLDEQISSDMKGLSQGEIQYFAIVRLYFYQASILILDEATSSIDPISEIKIQEILQKILQDKTAIIIAHRLSTIRQCDEIWYIENGAIQEKGDHQSLLKKQGKYFDLIQASKR
jgi:ATP-binding cassette subfamily B protein